MTKEQTIAAMARAIGTTLDCAETVAEISETDLATAAHTVVQERFERLEGALREIATTNGANARFCRTAARAALTHKDTKA